MLYLSKNNKDDDNLKLEKQTAHLAKISDINDVNSNFYNFLKNLLTVKHYLSAL